MTKEQGIKLEKAIYSLYIEYYKNNGTKPEYLILGWKKYLELEHILNNTPHLRFLGDKINKYQDMKIIISKNKDEVSLGYENINNYDIQNLMVKEVI